MPTKAETLQQVCTERRTPIMDAYIALANAVIILRRLIRAAWTTHRWDTRPNPPTMTYPRDL